MRRVLFVTNDYLPMVGGVSNHIDALSRALHAFDCKVLILHICYDKVCRSEQNFDTHSVLRVAVCENHAGKNTLYSKLVRYLKSFTTAKTILNNIIDEFDPDIVHWHDYYHSSLTTKGLTKKRVLRVCTNHASKFLEQYQRGKYLHFFLKKLVSHADGIIAPSIELAEKSEIVLKPVAFIPNGVSEKEFFPTKKYRTKTFQRLGLGGQKKMILAPRRLDPKNGLEVLIKAIPHVIRSNEHAIFVIVGGGPPALFDNYRTLAKSIHVEQHLIFAGPLPYKEMQKIVSSADIVVIPSFIEAVSLAALEALACGVPVIASDVGGLPYIVNTSNGDLFPAGDHVKLAEKIRYNLKNWKQRIAKGREGRKQILAGHTWAHVAAETVKFYDWLQTEAATRSSSTALNTPPKRLQNTVTKG